MPAWGFALANEFELLALMGVKVDWKVVIIGVCVELKLEPSSESSDCKSECSSVVLGCIRDMVEFELLFSEWHSALMRRRDDDELSSGRFGVTI